MNQRTSHLLFASVLLCACMCTAASGSAAEASANYENLREPGAPNRPDAPEAFSATLELGTSGHGTLPGKMYYDATGNRMRIDVTVQGVTAETLLLYGSNTQYSVAAGQCTKGSVNGSASDLFRALQYTVYNGTVVVNGQTLDKWLFEAGNLFYLFAGETPVQFSVADAVSYTWSAYTSGEPDDSVFAVPASCSSSGGSAGGESLKKLVLEHVKGMHEMVEAGWETPARPQEPVAFSADVKFLSGGQLAHGKEYYDAKGDRVRVSLALGNVSVVYLFHFVDEVLYILEDGKCGTMKMTGHAAELFDRLRTAVYNGTFVYEGQTVTQWVDSADNTSFLFHGNTPVVMKLPYGQEYEWSNVDLEEPDASVFAVPSICKKSAQHEAEDVLGLLGGKRSPAKPQVPKEWTSYMSFAPTGSGAITGHFAYDAEDNRARITLSNATLTLDDLYLFKEDVGYMVLQGDCSKLSISGSVQNMFPVESFVYNGTETYKGRHVTRWYAASFGGVFLFAGNEPVALLSDIGTYEWDDVQVGKVPASAWVVPKECSKGRVASVRGRVTGWSVLDSVVGALESVEGGPPAKPQVPKEWTSSFQLTAGDTQLGKGEFAFDATGNRVWFTLSGEETSTSLTLYNEGVQYEVASGSCSQLTVEGSAMGAFDVESYEYNGTRTFNGVEVDVWYSTDSGYTYLFDGNTPVAQLDDSVVVEWIDVAVGPAASSTWEVPKECANATVGRSTWTGRKSASWMHVSVAAPTPQRPATPHAFQAGLTLSFNNSVALTGKFYLDDKANCMRLDGTYDGVTSEELFVYDKKILFTIRPATSSCSNQSTYGGSASDMFAALPTTVYGGKKNVNGQEADIWVSREGFLKYAFVGNTPVALTLGDNVAEYGWSDVKLGAPDASVWSVPSFCDAASDSTEMHDVRRMAYMQFVKRD